MEKKTLFTITLKWKQDYNPQQSLLETKIERILKITDYKEAKQVIDTIKNKLQEKIMKILATCISLICLVLFMSNIENSDVAMAWAIALAGWAGLAWSKE